MNKYYLIAGLVVIVVVALTLLVGFGIAAYMKGGFSNINFMAGESEFDKLIKKINTYLKRR
jgi:major membrane immunogen (membrane-anchored lipoprotein)